MFGDTFDIDPDFTHDVKDIRVVIYRNEHLAGLEIITKKDEHVVIAMTGATLLELRGQIDDICEQVKALVSSEPQTRH